MVKVKTLRSHDNSYGDSYRKAEGDEYSHPDPQGLVDAKLVQVVVEKVEVSTATPPASPPPGSPRSPKTPTPPVDPLQT